MTLVWLRACYVALVAIGCVYLLAPTVVVALASFAPGQAMRFPPEGFSLRWYANFFAREEFTRGLTTSLSLAVAVAIASTALAVTLVVALRRRPSVAVRAAALAPAILPTIVLGPALLFAGAGLGVTASLPGAVLLLGGAHVVLTLPYAWQVISAEYASVPAAVEEAAEAAGAGQRRILLRVVGPMLLPGVIASLTFAFLVSFDEPVVSLFLARHDLTTLPVQVFTYLRFRADPTVAALSTMMSLVSLAAMLVADRLVGLDRIMGLRR
jgi:putative spermidine/putrescine transport system permease protein